MTGDKYYNGRIIILGDQLVPLYLHDEGQIYIYYIKEQMVGIRIIFYH